MSSSKHSWKRTVTKAITYRSMGFLVSWVTGLILGVSLSLNIAYTLVSNGLATVVWIAHEVVWRKTKFGKPILPST